MGFCSKIRRTGLALVALSVLGSSTELAHAAGIEDTVSGAVALGRAANYARVNDFMATWQNPANLAIAPASVGLELRLPIFNACFDRARDTRTDANGDPLVEYKSYETFGEVCNEASLMPAGNAGFVLRLSESLGLGAGFFTPAGIGSLKFGSDNIVTVNPQPGELYRPTTTGTQSPNRALLLDREILAGFLSVGLGYAPSKMVRVGASLAAGFADVSYRNVASLGPGFLDQEVVNDVRVQDLFIPRATVGATISPGEAVDLSATFIWNADIEADGYVDVTSNGIKGAPRRSCVADDPGTRCRIDGVRLEVPYQRFEIVLGARYVDRIDAGVLSNDPMENERWDIEIDGYWVNTGHVDDYTLTLYDLDPDAPVVPAVAFSSDPNANAPSGLPPVARLPHEWNDTFGVRVGGDYVIIPGMLAARAGVAYETRGVPVENMNLDYWPVSKLAVHVGATYRIGLFDLTVAYAHIFNETIDVAVGEGNLREVTAITPDQALVVNEGRYTSSIDVISLQGNYRF